MTTTPTTDPATRAANNRALDLALLGDDGGANTVDQATDDELLAALEHAIVFDGHDRATDLLAYRVKSASGPASETLHFPSSFTGTYIRLWIWHNREGQPWQASLEAHVQSWRREPTDWYTPENRERLLKAFVERGAIRKLAEVAAKIGDIEAEPNYVTSGIVFGLTVNSETLVAAALAVLRQETKENNNHA